MRVFRRPLFLQDVEECADYLATEAGEVVARRWKQSLGKAISLITKAPEIGRIRHDLPFPGIRSFFLREFPRFLVFYRISGHTVELLRVRHGMMHLPRLFEGPKRGNMSNASVECCNGILTKNWPPMRGFE